MGPPQRTPQHTPSALRNGNDRGSWETPVWSNAMAKGWIVSRCTPWGMKNTPLLYLKLMDSVSEKKKKRREDGKRFGYLAIKRFSLPLNLLSRAINMGADQNSPFLTKRLSNEGLSIPAGWLVNLSIMSNLKASGLATVSLCAMHSFKRLTASRACFEEVE